MKNFNFEKQISEKLENAQEQPSSDLFNSIMQKRNQKTKPSIPVFYKYGALALIGLLSVTTLYFYSNNESKIAQNNVNQTEYADDNQNSDLLDENQPNDNNVNKLNNISVKKSTNKQVETREIEQNVRENKTVNNTSFITKTESVEINNNPKIDIKNSESVNINNSFKNDKLVKTIISSSNFENNNPFENYFNPESTNRPVIEKYESKGSSHLYVYNTFGEFEIDQATINFLSNIKLKKVKTNHAPSEDLSKLNTKYRNFAVKNRRPIYIDLMVTPMFTYHKIIAGTNTAKFYKNFEKITPNYFVEGRITIPIKHDFTFYTGISYGKLNTLYSGRFTEKEKVTENVERVIFINDPITGQSREERFIEQIEVDKYTTYQNNFRNVAILNQIPLGLGYNFGYKKFDFAANGGMVLNLLHSSNGTDLKYMNENSFKFNGSKTTYDFGYSFGAMAAYNVSRKIKYFIEPSLSSFNLNNSNYGSLYQQKITNLGLKLGIRYNLN